VYTPAAQYVSRVLHISDNKHKCVSTVLVLCSISNNTCCEELSRLLSILVVIIFIFLDMNLGQCDVTSNNRHNTTCITVKSHYNANQINCSYDDVPTRQKLETRPSKQDIKDVFQHQQ